MTRNIITGKTGIRCKFEELQVILYKYIKELPKIYSLTIGTDIRASLRELSISFTKAYMSKDIESKAKLQIEIISNLEFIASTINSSTKCGATRDSVEDILTALLELYDQVLKWYKYNDSRVDDQNHI